MTKGTLATLDGVSSSDHTEQMAKTRKTRFTVNTQKIRRTLFSVSDTASDGTLTVLVPELKVRNLFNESREYEVVDAHISVHPSRGIQGNIINLTTKDTEGNRIIHRSHVTSPSPQLLWPLVFRRQWFYDQDEIAVIRPKDMEVFLFSYDQRGTPLFYSLWIASKSVDIPPCQPPFTIKTFHFRNFRLVLYFTSSPLMAFPDGHSIHVGTHEPKINNIDPSVIVDGARSLTGTQVHQLLMDRIHHITDVFIEKVSSELVDDEELEEIIRLSRMFGYQGEVEGMEGTG